ncbi:hypothetical protein DH2020_003414 [Rehmannia glutinosa]|uniref:Uncharacterized protein n=1 Tax=Rehmannia glutinosa TaxID=99300 RepID=A0ABR0XLZ8_REHGL
MAAPSAVSPSSLKLANGGPFLTLLNKRLRALRKKRNRIYQMEESLAQGKALNKEQKETLRSKSSVIAGIEEIEKLREPLLQAVDQEIQLALEKNKQNAEILEPDATGENEGLSAVSDLLGLLYFGSLFDVSTLMRANDNMLTRMHERNCCLTYDYVTDDDAAGDPLKEWDLDSIAMIGVYAGLRQKLNKIMASEYYTTAPEIKAPFEVAAAVGNYTSFQVPVHGSVIPQVGLSVPVEGSAAEYEQECHRITPVYFDSQFPTYKSCGEEDGSNSPSTGAAQLYLQKLEVCRIQAFIFGTYLGNSPVVKTFLHSHLFSGVNNVQILAKEEESPNANGSEVHDNETGHVEKLHQGGSEVESVSELQAQTELRMPDTEDPNSRDMGLKEQRSATQRPYQNYIGGHGGGGRRGYANGRGV